MFGAKGFWIRGLFLIALGTVFGSFVEFRWHPQHLQALQVQASVSSTDATDDNQLPIASFSPVVKKALPAVVKIDSTRVVQASDHPENPMIPDDSWLRQFFADAFPQPFQMPPEQRQRGLGSGVIVDPAGYILTNHHVVEGANDIRITLSDGRELQAQLAGADPKSDLALLKVDSKDLPYLVFEDSSKLQVGDIVLAIGNPFPSHFESGEQVITVITAHGTISTAVEAIKRGASFSW